MDLIILFNTFFGFLTFIAWFSTAAILYLYFSKKTFSKLITDQFLNFAISVAVFSSIGSIVYSEVVGFIPCRFCWYQRYLMYPVAIALVISLFKRPFFSGRVYQHYWCDYKCISYIFTKRWWRWRNMCS